MTTVERITKELEGAGIESARLDAFMLLEHVCGKSREWLLAHPEYPPTEKEQVKLNRLVRERKKRIPLAYLLGSREFYGQEFITDENVLVPRPETEILVEYAIEHTPKESKVLELGTGSGAIALSLAHGRSDLQITATDVSPEALKVARQNTKSLGLDIDLIESDLFTSITGKYDVVLANLPYVPVSARRQPEIEHEPDIALYGGEDGLDYYRTFLAQLSEYLKPNGFSVIEFSPTQYAEMRKLCKKYSFEIEPISEYIYLVSRI